MAGRYPDYDWRGIAMLTQQLGQLFEPSKARLMSQQQEHEMNMLMAKQAWKTQSDQLDALKVEHKALVTKVDAETEAVNILGGRDLVRASMGDGALPGEPAEVFDKTSLKNLSDMQEADITYRKAISELENNLSNMKTYNAHGKMGEHFSKRMTSLPGAKDQKEYDVLAESDGIPGLSYKEKQKALSMYLKDTGQILNEGDEGYSDGMDQKIWNGAEYEDLKVKPEGFSFIAGYNSTLDKEAISGKTLAGKIDARANKFKTAGYKDMDPKKLANLYNQTQTTLQTLNDKYDYEKNDKWTGGTIAEAFSYTKDGIYALHEDATKYQKMEPADLDAYSAARNNATLISKAMSAKGLPVHQELATYGIKYSKDMDNDFKSAVPGVGLDVTNMYRDLIETDPSKQGHAGTVAMFDEFLRNYDSYTPAYRATVIKGLYDWMNK